MHPTSAPRWVCLLVCLALSAPSPGTVRAEDAKPIKALLITGGPFHDYAAQKAALTEGIGRRANVEWTVYHTGDKGGTAFKMPIYENEDWAKGYDVVVHNECFADVQDEAFIRKICKAHADGVPAVFVHCCMHTFRAVKNFDEYRKMLGVTTTRHEKSRTLEVKPAGADHPIMKGFPAVFETPVPDEAYVIDKVWPDCTPLATAYGSETKKDQPCMWVNRYGKARVFGTTLGHRTEVIASDVYLDTMANGLLWVCDKLGEDGKPVAGYGPKKPAEGKEKPAEGKGPGDAGK